ncbi:MAG: FxsA family protein [Kiloniellaceae bacterium]
MALILLAVFIGLPLLEVAVFIQVGGAIGLWPTIAATIVTALAGSLLLRTQGLAALTRARAQMDQGQLPAREMFEGLCLVLAGALLLVPGFVTDALGLLLFFPPFRDLLRLLVARHIAAKAARGEARVFVDGIEIDPRRPGPRRSGAGTPRRGGKVIDGDYEDVSQADNTGDDDDNGAAPPQRRIGR